MKKTTERYCNTPNCIRVAARHQRKCEVCKKRIYRANNILMAVYSNLKFNAKARRIKFQLTLKEFKDFCVEHNYLELRGKTATSLSIDRIIEDGPYSRDNIQVLPLAANTAKRRAFERLNWSIRVPREPGDPF
jgi:hypothetical protein